MKIGFAEVFLTTVMLCSCAIAETPTLSLELLEGGVRFSCGPAGTFELSHPRLVLESGGDPLKPVQAKISGNVCSLSFKDGGSLTVTLKGTQIGYHLTTAPKGFKNPLQEMFVPINFNQGGMWYTDEKSGTFPLVKIGPKLFQGHTSTLGVASPDKARLTLSFSVRPWGEVQDNREWGWPIFWYGMHLPGFLRDWTVDVSLDARAFKRKQLLDKFGQVDRGFPGKVSDEAELKADASTDAAYYKTLDFQGRLSAVGYRLDPFGGLADVGLKMGFKKTGFFHCEKKTVAGRARWYLVDPLGNPFFHLGVCSFGPAEDYTDVTGREAAFAWLPPHEGPFAAAWKDRPGDWWNNRAVSFYKANIIRKYGKYADAEETVRQIARVRSVGFNSIGAFSDVSAVATAQKMPRVAFVNVGEPRMIPSVRGLFDPFDSKSRAEVARGMKNTAKDAEDPFLIGYFIANEQAFEDLPAAIPALDASFAAKRALVKWLQRKYGDIAAFNTAWGTSASDFKALEKEGLAVSTAAATADAHAFAGLFTEAYYALIEKTFRANDPNHLLLGSRWQPRTAENEALCRAAGRHVDVISINYYTSDIDPAFVRRVYDRSGGKPQFWSEFYYTSAKESNNGPSGFDRPTQKARGEAYRAYVEGAASSGFAVGIEWFTLIDQAATGRYFEGENGERANTGLLNVADRPYKDLLTEMLATHLAVYPVWFGTRAPWRPKD